MFRFGPFGAGSLGGARPGAAPAKGDSGDLFRIVIMAVLALVVTGLALGFMMKGSEGGAGPSPAPGAQPSGPLGPVPDGKQQVKMVPDPGEDPDDIPEKDKPEWARRPDPGAVAEDGQPKPRRPLKPLPFVEDTTIYDDVEQSSRLIEPRALWHLMHKAVTCDPQLLHKQAKRVKFSQFFNDPDTLIGQPVKFTGSLFQIMPADPDKFPADPMRNPSGVQDAVWGYVVDSAYRPCHFYAPFNPDVDTRSVLTIEGFFLKVYEFDNSAGQARRAPLLVVRNIIKVPEPAPEPIVWFGIPLLIGDHVLSWLEVGLLMAVIISLPLAIWYFRIERRGYEEFRRKAIEIRKKRVAKPGAETAAEAPTEAPAEAPGETPAEESPPEPPADPPAAS